MSEAGDKDRIRRARAAGSVSVAVLASRILGLVREQVLAAIFGAGFAMDAWQVAFRIPNMLRDLFAEGAFSSAFVPTFTRALKGEGDRRARELVSRVSTLLVVILGLVSLVFFLFARQFVWLIAGGFSRIPGKVELTADLLRIVSPFLLLVALAAVAMGVLNTHHRFFLPALAPATFNLCLILAGLLLAPFLERLWGWPPILAIGLGALAGGACQLGVQLPSLARLGYRFWPSLDLGDPGVRRIAALLAPAAVGVGAVQLNVLVNTQIASLLGDGPVSWLGYSFRLIYLPIGLFGVAVGVVNLREVSLSAASGDWDGLKETLAGSIKLVTLLAIPSAVGLVILARPVIRLIYQRGAFDVVDTERTAMALMFYALGLFFYSGVKQYVPTFYALGDTRTPVRISLLSVMINLLVNLALVFALLPPDVRFAGLALGTSISVGVNYWLLGRAFRARLGSLGEYGVRGHLARVGVASLVMGLFLLLGRELFEDPSGGLVRQLTFVGGSILGGAGIYFGLCWMLGVEEIRILRARLKA